MMISHDTWDTLNQQALKVLDATVSGTLRSLGETFLGSTLIAGDLTVDGTLAIIGDSLSVMGTRCLQNGPVAKALDLFDGKVSFGQDGSLALHEGGLAVAKGTISGNDTIRGRVQLRAGTTELRVDRSWKDAPIIVQLNLSYNARTWVENLTDKGFTVRVDTPAPGDKDIYWLVLW
jgi:hypothetical protein